jgi:hypothetical protein
LSATDVYIILLSHLEAVNIQFHHVYTHTPIYRNTFTTSTVTFLKFAVSLEQIVQNVTCHLKCQNLKKKKKRKKKCKLKCTFKDYKQKVHETHT